MPSTQGAKIKRTYIPVTTQMTVTSLQLKAQDISAWRQAINSARSATSPRRKLLYELFENLIMDGRLDSVIEKRRIAITNKQLTFQPKEKGAEIPEGIMENILETPWMTELIGHGIDQVAWGHSLVELIPEGGMIQRVELVPRINVRPEDGFLQLSYGDLTTGFYYRNDPTYSPYLIEFGTKKDYGKIMVAAQYVIFKRGGFGDWAQFVEIFGQPFRSAKYNPHDPESRNKLVTAMEEMGGAAYAVIPDGTSIEFHNAASAGQSALFRDLIKACNEEISIIFLGQTMTTDNGSSKSQSQTHKEVEEDINISDMIRLEHVLNWQFKPKMIALGAKELEHGNIRFVATTEIPLEERIKIDVEISGQLEMDGMKLPDEYWVDTYGIPNPVEKTKVDADPIITDKKEPASKKKVSTQPSAIKAFYEGLPAPKTLRVSAAKKDHDKIWDRIVKDLHSGKLKKGDIDPELWEWIKKELMEAVTQGYGSDLSAYEPDTADYALLKKIDKNVHVFSGYKTYQELKEATAMLVNEAGELRNFSEFKRLVSGLNETFNVNYLRSEYELAVASSQMAEQWVEFEAAKEDFPLLEYSTVGDDAVRDSHAALDGVIQPVDSDFWDTHYPPNGWGCRCLVKQLSKGEITDVSKVGDIVGMFSNNVGKNGIIFPDSHPYFTVDKTDKATVKKTVDGTK